MFCVGAGQAAAARAVVFGLLGRDAFWVFRPISNR
jgi:hypothetical protein